MKTYTIGENDARRRLDQFMARVLKEAPESVIYKSLRKKRVKVNGKRVTDGAVRLCSGDEIELYINDEFFGASREKRPPWLEASPEVDVVYEDGQILIVNKPSGMPAQDDAAQNGQSLESRMRAYLWKKGEYCPERETSFVPSLCHRIDRNTAGLVIGAKTAQALREMNEKIRSRQVCKFYLCRTQGIPTPEQGQIKGWLLREEAARKMRFSLEPVEGGTACETRYRVLDRGKNALVEVELLTGRTHQIRACMAYLGHPLVGDVKYGARKDGGHDYQQLVSYRLVFDFPPDGGCLDPLSGREITLKPEKSCSDLCRKRR